MFNYICIECGEGIVEETVFENYQTKFKGHPFTVPKARIGVCNVCGGKHYNSNETKRWEKDFMLRGIKA